MPRISLPCVVVAALLTPVPSLFAWKPKTHVYLAEQAMAEALATGKVTIYEIDPATNRNKLDRSNNPVKIGEYRVDPRTLEALRNHPQQFRAGVLGPDAFPDILTGQQIIHPAGRITPGETGVDLNKNGPGPDPWMQHLWRVAFAAKGTDATPATRAFVVGFLAHAAGDLYGHTCVNHYTGDAFHFNPQPANARRHIVVEGFFDKHIPAPTYQSSIGNGVDGFIHRQMILGRPGTPVARLLTGDNINNTLAGRFSVLRNRLEEDVKGGFVLNPVVAYKKAWIKDIDRGLERLPDMSHRLAIALMFNPSGKADVPAAKMIVEDYVKRHLLSMAGLPDAAGATIILFEKVADALKIPGLKEFVQEIKKDALNYIVKQATGMTVDQLKEALLAEVKTFDRLMDAPPLKYGHRTSQKEFLTNELKVPRLGNWIDWKRVPPAYNTVTLIKLSFLGKDEVNRLMNDLRSPERLAEENILFGFAATLDGSNQWRVNPTKLVLARRSADYRRVFMKQNGEDRVVSPPPPPPPVAKTTDYALTIKTSDRLFAGTDSNIFLTIVGKNGSTGEHRLNGLISGNAFERNQTDRCTLKDLKDVGDLISITVRSDDKFAASSWHLESITVQPKGKAAVRFNCNAWIEKGALTRTLNR